MTSPALKVVESSPIDEGVRAVFDAATLLREAQEAMQRIDARIGDVELERARSLTQIAEHRNAVTKALLENRRPPTQAPTVLDPADALKLLHVERSRAALVVDERRGAHRAACCALVQAHLALALEGYKAAVAALADATVAAAAADAVLMSAGLPQTLPPIMRTRLHAPALRHAHETVSPGLALDGGRLFESGAVSRAAAEFRTRLMHDLNAPLPF